MIHMFSNDKTKGDHTRVHVYSRLPVCFIHVHTFIAVYQYVWLPKTMTVCIFLLADFPPKAREFHAQPLPSQDLGSLPEKQAKEPTKPEPFQLETDLRGTHYSQELAHKVGGVQVKCMLLLVSGRCVTLFVAGSCRKMCNSPWCQWLQRDVWPSLTSAAAERCVTFLDVSSCRKMCDLP